MHRDTSMAEVEVKQQSSDPSRFSGSSNNHGSKRKCPYCGREFSQQSNLVRHIRIHTGEKPFKCSFCGKLFSDKGACNTHTRIHTHEGSCGCPYCGVVFSNKMKLKYHIRKHTGCDLLQCDLCKKEFTSSNALKEHKMIHCPPSQHICQYCSKSFPLKKYLQRHITGVHQRSLSLKCYLCSRGFSQKGQLKSHLIKHTGVKHIQCLLCNKGYTSLKALRHHLLNIHGTTVDHPDFKKCFYRMTLEEVGLSQSTLSSPPPVLKAFDDPISHEKRLREKTNTSKIESDEPPELERQEPCIIPIVPKYTIPHIRTKAAKKAMPFTLAILEHRSVHKFNQKAQVS